MPAKVAGSVAKSSLLLYLVKTKPILMYCSAPLKLKMATRGPLAKVVENVKAKIPPPPAGPGFP